MSFKLSDDTNTSVEAIFSDDSKGDSTIKDSSDSADDSILQRRSKRKFRRPVRIVSESEDDDQFEERALSPRTRMSITGVRPSDLSDDSSEIGYSSADETGKNSLIAKQASEVYSENSVLMKEDESENSCHETDEPDDVEKNSLIVKEASEVYSENSVLETEDESENSCHETDEPYDVEKNSLIAKEASVVYSENSVLETEDESEDSCHETDEPITSAKSAESVPFQKSASEETRNSDAHMSYKEINPTASSISLPDRNSTAARYSTMFEPSIKDKMSSTIYPQQSNNSVSGSEKSSNDSDVVIMTKKGTVVDISSDDGDLSTKEPVAVKLESEKLTQPKITASLSRQPSSSENVIEKKFVSEEFYNKEVKKLNELKSDLVNAESLLEKLRHSLYDGGKQLSLRVESLKIAVKKKAKEIVSFVIEDNGRPIEKEKPNKPFFNKDTPNWDDLSAAVNQIQPVYTGKQGLNTFNKQKVLTIERLKDIHGSLETCPSDDVLADDPKGLKISLMTHQKHALAWLNWREHQKPRGGILADDMGLGKTLTMIAMVLAYKNQEEDNLQDVDDSDDEEEKENQGWSTKNRRDYYNGGSLVVCPASLMRQWEKEVENRVARHKLSVCVHHGNNRDTKPRHLATYDIVITTYNIVSREAKTHGALFSINWKRIILDEAHVVRNHKSQSSVAVCELKGKFRWVLTGTPIQNKEMDVYALLKFLKCTPFDDLSHWKKWIDNKSAGGQQRLNTLMKSLMLRRTKAQLQQLGSLMCLPERECKLIEVNLDKDEMNVYQKIMTYSKTLFAQFLYQRAEKNNDLYFSDQGNKPTFKQTKDPNGAYYKMHQKFSRMHHGGKEIKSHEILVLLLRLRQICCHPGLIDAMLEDEDAAVPSDSDTIEPEIDLLDQLNKLAINDNNDSNSILTDSTSHDAQHEAISKASAKVLQRSNPVFDLSRPSSKMNEVLRVVNQHILKSSDKGIIISQWTSFLNILKDHLAAKGIHTLSLNGAIPVKNRQNIVTEFNDPNTKPKILLLSLTAGGVGLNLVGANHLFLIDLHWNPQLESQAQDRIYRVGQKKPVHIYKFMCKDTVEERIKALQDQKLEIAKGILTGVKASEGSKLSIDDLKGLFGL